MKKIPDRIPERISQRQADIIARNRAKHTFHGRWTCTTCGEGVDEFPRRTLEKKWGKAYADQTTLTPCKCLRALLEKENTDDHLR